MPWNTPDLNALTYEECESITWDEIKVIECDKELKEYITANLPAVHELILRSIRLGNLKPDEHLVPVLRGILEADVFKRPLAGESDMITTLIEANTILQQRGGPIV